MEKFQNKYRIESTRLQKWNYGWKASYFITICTANRENFFGKVVEGEMILSEIGKISENEWFKTLEMRPDMNIQMGEFVVMPNHFHAIITIGENKYNSDRDDRDAMHCVSKTTIPTTTIPTTTNAKNKFGPQSKNLSSIIRGFKSAVTIGARKIDVNFSWQSSFHDHIIRDFGEYQRISNYIINNPRKWKKG